MDDLISRQAAIDAYILHTMDYLVGEKPRRAFTEVLREMPPAQPEVLAHGEGELSAQQWIPCSERLPDKDGIYLVTHRKFGKLEVTWNIFYGGEHASWLWNDEIIAWMPLPEPYKGEET